MDKQRDVQTIKFSTEQFLALLKIIYLGNWVANAHLGDAETNPRLTEYEEIENYVFSHAKVFGLAEYVDDELAEDGEYFPPRMFEESQDVMEAINEYDDDTFWDELIEYLADRDFTNQYSKSEIQKMTIDERIDKLYIHIDRWAKEFDKHSPDTLTIKTSQQEPA